MTPRTGPTRCTPPSCSALFATVSTRRVRPTRFLGDRSGSRDRFRQVAQYVVGSSEFNPKCLWWAEFGLAYPRQVPIALCLSFARCVAARADAARFRPGRSRRDGPRARARVRSAPKRSRGHQGNTPSSIERRKEARKALRPSGRSQKTPGGVIQAFHFCGTNFISYCFYVIIGGEGGIRTLGTLFTHTHFPGVLLRPLGHLSKARV